jgi:cystathionine gamma-synthase/methionine-gamma-lyase
MSGKKQNLDFTTLLVHEGERPPAPNGKPVATPIYATATFTYDSMDEMDKVFAGEIPGYVYTRYGNPTVAALEKAVQKLEEGAFACAYASGMAALHAALFACQLSPSATVLASQDLYGATLDLLFNIFGSFGINTVTADFNKLEDVREAVTRTKPSVLVAETISNPLLKVCDIAACAEIAHAAGAKLIVDNTFASPYLCQPLKQGADFSVHSATKYLSGHCDVMGGAVVAREEADKLALIGVMKLVGGVLGPWDAHEILRGVKTLAVRLDRQCSNASYIATQLATHPIISRVHYPGLIADKDPTVYRTLRQDLAGALLSIELNPNTREAAFQFMDSLELCVRSTSLGDVFTGVLHPATASHREMAPARRKQLGISDGLVRVAVGIESAQDILADIHQALAAVEKQLGAASSVGARRK